MACFPAADGGIPWVFHGYSAGISPAVSNLKVKMWYTSKKHWNTLELKNAGFLAAALRCAPPLVPNQSL